MLIGDDESEAAWLAAQREACDDNLEEEDDEELLRHVPCANDIVPMCEGLATQPAQSFCDVHGPTDVAASSRHDLCAVASLHVPGMEAVVSGVCDFPPLSQVSFMMRGDNGVVRWITASGLDANRASRKRRRDMDGMDDDNSNVEEEEGEEDVGVTQVLRRRRTGSGLGYVNIPALLQQLYDEAAAVDECRAVRPQLLLPSEQKGGEEELWVMKYSPKRFRDLLSDDNINLRLLQWLKSWDAYIFQGASVSGGTTATTNTTTTDGSLVPARPEERLAVLVGPPGVGKTTLAHVLAAHCGYETIEINASVDRTTSRIENAIQLAVAPARRGRRAPPPTSSSLFSSHGSNATRTTTTTTAAGGTGVSLVDMLLRPKCLIIDEMDGIAANVASFLLQQDIHCPVFCLCNDYYVPSLRELRRQCQHVYHFSPIRPQRLLSRLSEIAEREGMSISQPALAELVQSSNGDVRCCLNTLQFFYRHASQSGESTETLRLIREMQGKDSRLGLWDSWRAVFERQERAKYIQLLRKEHGIDYEEVVTLGNLNGFTNVMAPEKSFGYLDSRQQRQHQQETNKRRDEKEHVVPVFRMDPGYVYVSRLLQQCSEMSTLLDGLQEYYLQRSYADYSLHSTCSMSNAFSFQDNLATSAYRDAASASLIPFVDLYASTTAASCFSYCGSSRRGGVSIGFPRELAGANRRLAESVHIARTFRDGCCGETAAHLCSVDVVSQEVVPLLLRCLLDVSLRVPAYSIASISALSQRDQQLLLASIIRHAEYGLTYARSLSASGRASGAFLFSPAGESGGGDEAPQERWELSPPIHRLGCVSVDAARGRPAGRGALAATVTATSALFSSSATPIMVLQTREEVRQLMVGEIQRVVIQNASLRAAKNKMGTNGSRKTTVVEREMKETRKGDEMAALPPVGKRLREEKEGGGNETTDDRKKNVKREIETTVPSHSTATAVSSLAPSKSKLGGKRDFFGRLISGGASTTSTRTTATTTCEKRERAKLTVQYTYHDGSTNAVKIPAVFADF